MVRMLGVLTLLALAGPATTQAQAPDPALSVAARAHTIPGTVWRESENGWTGTWRRRGTSDTFDAEWTKDGGHVVAVLKMTMTGANAVSIYRHDTNAAHKVEVDYKGTIDSRGRVSGTGKVRQTGFQFTWTATIQDWGKASTAPAAGTTGGSKATGAATTGSNKATPPGEGKSAGKGHDLLGKLWHESENGWSGTWRRRGTTNTFDAEWTKGGDRVVAVLKMTITGPDTVSIHRQDTVSTRKYQVDYTGRIDRSGKVKGTGKVRETGFEFSWTATVQ